MRLVSTRGLIAAFAITLPVAFTALALTTLAGRAFAAATKQPTAPSFKAQGISGKSYSLDDLKGKTVVLEWFNAGCPFVKRAYDSGAMQKLQEEYTKKGFVWLTVNSTNADHKDFLDAGAAKDVLAKWKSNPTDYVIDSDGTLGKLYGAKTTPHMFVIGPDGSFAYRGAFDNYPDAGDETAKIVPHLENALKETASNKAVTLPETQEYGCSIKYAS